MALFNRIIVPVDGSERSLRAITVGDVLATQCGAELEILQVVSYDDDIAEAVEEINTHLTAHPLKSTSPLVTAAVVEGGVAETIARHLAKVNGSQAVMSSTGRGRTQTFLGSVAAELLGIMYGPIVVVGDEVDVERWTPSGPLVVPVDGSDTSEHSLGLAGAWGLTLHARPWVVTVVDPGANVPRDVSETSYPSRLAGRLGREMKQTVEFDVLHDDHPARGIVRFAHDRDAALVVASTHGRTGLARMALGSVAMGVVRHAPCPVVLSRPPTIRTGDGRRVDVPAPSPV